MFSEFSRGYYLGRLYVEPRDGDRAVMHRDQHERVNEQLYADGEGLERLDVPLVMKLDNRHFAVHGDAGVPERTLAVPDHLIADATVRNPPTLREILLAKADRATQLLRLSGQLDDPDVDAARGGDGPSRGGSSPGSGAPPGGDGTLGGDATTDDDRDDPDPQVGF